ncbi:PAS domain S-box protein [Hymenobacter sp. CRA2]|uniref:PAS domain S-box protein n=1 Tax=Hymenobacter sp. CRA2 TaxID=1955620 RepID=UPI00098FAE29|nr:PAS domain S-box protein [Hymenobacter sp. CRA2]OON69659.1 hypothetical protein B0919_06925 [Hymenobacter sp. CRA2]
MTVLPDFGDYLALFRHLPGSFLLLSPDADFTVVDHTEQHAAASMKQRADVVGRPIFEAYPAADQNEAAVLRASLEHVRQHHEAHTMPVIRYDLERPAALGGGLEERYWQATHYPVPGPDGQLRFILQQTEDVTAQHLAAQHRRQLAESQERNRLLLESLPIMIWTTRPDGWTDYQNPWWLRFTGRSIEEAAGWGWIEDMHPDDRPGVNEAWQRALQTGDDYQVEYRLRRHDGQYRWILVQAVAQRNAAGAITAWLGTGTDIHAQKVHQQQLAAKDEQLLQILTQLPASVATVVGPDYRYSFFTPSYQQQMGGRIRLGERAADLLPEVAAQGHIALLDEVYHNQRPYVGLEIPAELHDPATGGTRQYFMNLAYQPLLDAEGRTQGILAFGIDVTEQVQARQRAQALQAEVHRSTEQLRRMAESLPIITYINEANGEGHYVSPQWYAYTGLPEGSSIASHWREVTHPDDLPRVEAEYRAGRQERRGWRIELRFRGRDGQYRWFLNQATPELNVDGQVLRWYGSNTDIDDQKRFQQELERKDEQFQRMLQSFPAIVNTMEGPEHRYTYISQQIKSLFGERVYLGVRMADALPELVEQGFLRKLDEVYRTGQPFTATEQRVNIISPVTGELEPHYFNFTYQLLPELVSRPESRGILSFAIDVTEQVQARQRAQALQAEVHRQDRRLRRLTEALPAISFILGSAMRLEYVSPQWYSLTGYAQATDVDAVWPTLIHPDDWDNAYVTYSRALAANEALEFEYRLRQADGQYRWQVCRIVPEPGPDGQVVRWYGTLVDNHAQKELQHELLRSEARYRFLAESIPQLVWTAEPDGSIDYMNQRWEELTGRPMQQALNLDWAALVPPEDVDTVVGKFLHDIRAGHDYEQESQLYSAKDGQYRWFLHRATAMRNAEGQIVKWFGASTDIHDSKQAQQQLQAQNEQLRRINEDLDNFVYTASHDLRQPVTNMAGIFEELMRTATFADPAAQTLVRMFERALHQMHDTVQDLAQVVQVQRQHEQLPAEAIELRPFAREIVRLVLDQQPSPDAELVLDFAAVPVLSFVRPNLQSVLYNLLSNALKYAMPGRPARVEVSTTLENGTPVIRVQDNGLGLDLQRHGTNLFKMFRRFHDHVEGSGMGLYLVNRIVQQAHGRLTVESVVGEGTTFCLYLPNALPSSPPAVAQLAANSEEQP